MSDNPNPLEELFNTVRKAVAEGLESSAPKEPQPEPENYESFRDRFFADFEERFGLNKKPDDTPPPSDDPPPAKEPDDPPTNAHPLFRPFGQKKASGE